MSDIDYKTAYETVSEIGDLYYARIKRMSEEIERLNKENEELKKIQCTFLGTGCKAEIERLNKKIEQYENPEDMTLMFMWCDEKAKDEIKRLNKNKNDVIEFIERYLKLNLEAFDTKSLLNKILEIVERGDDIDSD